MGAARAGHHAEANFGESELRPLIGHPQIAAQCQLQTATEGVGLDGSDGGYRKPGDPSVDGLLQEQLAFAHPTLERLELFDIRSRAEGAIAGAREHHTTDVGIPFDTGQGTVEAPGELDGDEIQRRVLQSNRRNRPAFDHDRIL